MKSVGSASRWRAISGGPPEIPFNPFLPPELAGESVERWFGRAACAPNLGRRRRSRQVIGKRRDLAALECNQSSTTDSTKLPLPQTGNKYDANFPHSKTGMGSAGVLRASAGVAPELLSHSLSGRESSVGKSLWSGVFGAAPKTTCGTRMLLGIHRVSHYLT